MFALAAQEESTSISKNMRWSYQKRMESGQYITNSAPYGYTLNSSRELAIDPEESKVVKHIFDLYLSGKGKREIVQILNQEKIPPRSGDVWKYSSVKYILTNEKNFGDAVLQKKYTVNPLSHQRNRNTGQQQQYYFHGSQEAIIDKETFGKAQEIAAQRQKVKPACPHTFTHRILCPDCGRHFRQVNCSGKSYWLCPYKINRVSNCSSIRFSENKIIHAALKMMAKLYYYKDEYIGNSLSLLRKIEYNQTGSNGKLYEVDQTIAALNDKALVLHRLSNKGFITPEEFRAQNDTLAIERKKLTAQRKNKLAGSPVHKAMEKLEELQSILESWPGVPAEFDINVFDEIVEKIIPIDNNTLKFRLHCGLELTEVIAT